MRIWIATLLATLVILGAWGSSADAQQTSVAYRLFHWEGGSWVEYAPNSPLPAGGDQPGTNLWQYRYELCNFSFSTGIRELNVFFDSDNVSCSTFQGSAQPANWTGTQVGPFAPANNWRIRYRTLSTPDRVPQGDCNDQFTIDFLWTCPDLPGIQNYDAISSSGSDAGQTVPAAPVPVEVSSWGAIKDLYRSLP